MIDLDDRRFLRAEPRLLSLLHHYVDLAQKDREAWHPRVIEWEGISESELARWFGRLIACDWLEVDEGLFSSRSNGSLLVRYRATPSGRRIVNELLVPH